MKITKSNLIKVVLHPHNQPTMMPPEFNFSCVVRAMLLNNIINCQEPHHHNVPR